MKVPERIFIWDCEDNISRNYYLTEQKAVNAVIKRFTLPQSFGIPEFINTSNETLLSYIQQKLAYANSAECRERAMLGVGRDKDTIEFAQRLVGMLK